MNNNISEENSQPLFKFDILHERVSLHAHLTRFICVVMVQGHKFCTDVQFRDILEKIMPFSSKEIVLYLIEPSLRAYILYSQVNCGIWKKNGISLLNQVD